jgi:hypothetical protein
MSTVPPKEAERSQFARPDKKGVPTFDWTLTSSSLTDTVKLIAGPFDVLPVIFVPGIMGSNLKTKDNGKIKSEPIWRLDKGTFGIPTKLLKGVAQMNAGLRQKFLHPDRTLVDDQGAVPKSAGGTVYSEKTYRERGWGTVGEGSYHDYLLWLEQQLNPITRNPALWTEYYQNEATIGPPATSNTLPKLFPGVRMGMQAQPFGAEKQPFVSIVTDDLMARSKFMMPVYAAGYNWLASNKVAAEKLSERILAIIKQNNQGQFRCEQVILVTHSMGGLVARACAQLDGMANRIAGIVHGVMPAVGAAVAYRRCKVGMRDEDFGAGLVIGSTGQEVTAVFAQAPGALQLLPSQAYAPDWLRVLASDGRTTESWPKPAQGADPYESIYLRRDRWWGLVNEAWLSPKDGVAINWDVYAKNVEEAKKFHTDLSDKYHPNTYAFYGADPKQKSFEKVTWKIKIGIAPDKQARPSNAAVLGMQPGQIRMDGTTPEYVGGSTEFTQSYGMEGDGGSTYETSYWELHCEMQDGAGDGTVPSSSGAAPLQRGGANIQQQFKLTGFGHEPAYHNATAQRATLYAINKIVGQARRPT